MGGSKFVEIAGEEQGLDSGRVSNARQEDKFTYLRTVSALR